MSLREIVFISIVIAMYLLIAIHDFKKAYDECNLLFSCCEWLPYCIVLVLNFVINLLIAIPKSVIIGGICYLIFM